MKPLAKYVPVLVIVVASCTIFSFGQTRDDQERCRKVEAEIRRSTKVVKVNRNDVYDGECQFSFRFATDKNVIIEILNHKSEKESQKEFLQAFTHIIPTVTRERKETRQPINIDGYWTEAIAVKERYADHAMFLRLENLTFVLLSSDYQLLQEIERVLRTIKFTQLTPSAQ